MIYAQLPAPSGQNSQKVDVTTVSAATAVASSCPEVMVTVTALCFVVRGASPTAVINTSMALQPGLSYLLGGLKVGTDKLAFVTGVGTATAYVTPVT